MELDELFLEDQWDLKLTSYGDEGGDIAVDYKNDLAVVSVLDQVRDSLRRIFTTPKGAIASLVLDVDGIKRLNANFGNGAFAYRSEPLTPAVIAAMRQELRDCFLQEPRAVPDDIRTTLLPFNGVMTVFFDIDYHLADSGVADSIRLSRDADFSFT